MTEIEKAIDALKEMTEKAPNVLYMGIYTTAEANAAIRTLLDAWNTRTPPRITEEAVTAAAMALVGAKWDNGHRIVSGEKLSAREMASIEARAALTAALPLMGGDRG